MRLNIVLSAREAGGEGGPHAKLSRACAAAVGEVGASDVRADSAGSLDMAMP